MTRSAPAAIRPRTVVLGLGNLLLGDEGAGVHVVETLRLAGGVPGVELVDGGTAGLSLLSHFDGAGLVVIVDAAADGKPAGTVTRLRPEFGRDLPPVLTAHEIGLKSLFDALALADERPDVELVTISVVEPDRASLALSPAVDRAVREAAERVRELLSARWGSSTSR